MSLCKIRRTSGTLINQWLYSPLERRRTEEQLSMCQGAQLWHSKTLLFFCKKLDLTASAIEEPSLHVKTQLPFVHVTDMTQADPEHLCTGVPEPGLPGLKSYDSTIGKNGHLHRPCVPRPTANGLPPKLQKIAAISKSSDIIFKDTNQPTKKR